MLSAYGLRGVRGSQPILLYCDNKSSLFMATNPTFHEQKNHNLKLTAT